MSPQENSRAIENFVRWLNLNKETAPGPWVPVQGFNAITKFEFGPSGSFVFTPIVGFPVKAFLNTQTGEVKMYDARNFIING